MPPGNRWFEASLSLSPYPYVAVCARVGGEQQLQLAAAETLIST